MPERAPLPSGALGLPSFHLGREVHALRRIAPTSPAYASGKNIVRLLPRALVLQSRCQQDVGFGLARVGLDRAAREGNTLGDVTAFELRARFATKAFGACWIGRLGRRIVGEIEIVVGSERLVSDGHRLG